jgi:cobalt-zinc-cadmium efflux system outer membrane protein
MVHCSGTPLLLPCLAVLSILSGTIAFLSAAEPARYPLAGQRATQLTTAVRRASLSFVPVEDTEPTRQALQTPASAPPSSGSPFLGTGELLVEALVQQVLARNPSVAQMVAAWQAASARYPQVTSLEDPMFAATIGPGTIAPDDPGINFAYRLEISQKYPWPGKRKLRGDNALAEAHAAGQDVEDMRLQLVESAKDAFYDYYLVARALEVNQANRKLLREFQDNAETRYKTGLVPEQDILQAKVEIGRQEERQMTLERMRRVAVARINTLLNLPPDQGLPPPPAELLVKDELPDAHTLRAHALARRPDLLALQDRLAAEQAALALACKELYPDLEPFLMYDRFMGNNSENRDLATMIGVRLNLPVRLERRYGAIAEAQARINQRRAELDRQVNQVNFDVQQAYEQVLESAKVAGLYQQRILPDAERNVKAAQRTYVAGKIPFVTLLDAERALVGLRDRYYETVADYFRRAATLERATGGPLTPPPPPGPAVSGHSLHQP